MLTMRPLRCERIAGSTACVMRRRPKKFVSNSPRASSMLVSSAGPMRAKPALLTRTSMRPASSRTFATPSSTERSSRTSSRIRSTFASTAMSVRTVPNVRNPIAASRTAVALPIPEETPVTKATFIVFTPLDDDHHLLVSKKSVAAKRLEKHLPRGSENRAPQPLVRHRAGHRQAAGHAGHQRDHVSAPLRVGGSRNIKNKGGNTLKERAIHDHAHGARLTRHFRNEGRDRTTAGRIGAVLLAQVQVDHRAHLLPGRGALDGLPHPGPRLLECLPERLGEEIVLALEVAIEPAMRQLQRFHERGDPDPRPAAPEAPRRHVNDPLSYFFLVFRRITHLGMIYVIL